MMAWMLLWMFGVPGGELAGIVTTADGDPIPYANVVVKGTGQGTACDALGRFSLRIDRGRYILNISAMGYCERTETVTIADSLPKLIVMLHERVLESKDAVIIYGNRNDGVASNKRHSIDDQFVVINGVQIVQRANFASEPVIRGSGADRIAIVVDGMPVYSACVDKMDPVSAYVETENLDRLEIDKDGSNLNLGQQIGGAVNLIPEKPRLREPLSIRSSVSYEHVSSLRRFMTIVQSGGERWAVRASASVKKAGDYTAGGGRRVDNSGFTKINAYGNVLHQISERQALEIYTILDGARDIGYPSMIMDTRQTRSWMASVRYSHRPSTLVTQWKIRAYANRIMHWMDDYDRDVTIRPVMQGMYMPMYGESETIGLNAEAVRVSATQMLKLTLDVHRLGAFADMTMKPLDPTVRDMELINLAAIGDLRASATLDFRRRLSSTLEFGLNGRLDGLRREPANDEGIRSLKIFYPDQPLSWTRLSASISNLWKWDFTPEQSLSMVLSHLMRQPTPLESHGYFLYNSQEGRFYVGNPSIRPESKQAVDLEWRLNSENVQARTSVFFHSIQNTIAGRSWDPEFYTYTNVPKALVTGFEAEAGYLWHRHWFASASITAMRGTNRSDDEPLPLMSPWRGRVVMRWTPERMRHELLLNWAAPQRRVSRLQNEDATAGYQTVDWNATFRVSSKVELRLGIENIFDEEYHDHLSFNNLMARGRNIYAGLDVVF